MEFGLKILIGVSAITLAALAIVIYYSVKNGTLEPFDGRSGQPWPLRNTPTTGVGSFTPNAGPNAWFKTFGRECEPGLTKCVGPDNQYFCSSREDCHLKNYNLRGTPLKEPMSWFMRHV